MNTEMKISPDLENCQTSKNKRLPDWDLLRHQLIENCQYLSGDPKQACKWLEPDHRKWTKKFLNFVCQATVVLTRKSDTRKLCNEGWPSLYLFVLEQVYRNHVMASHDQSREYFYRPYHQLPCDESTRIRRVDQIELRVKKESPLLLIGDDDLQTIELLKRGYKDITVIEIDKLVVAKIKATIPKNSSVVILQKPIQEVDSKYQREFHAIIMDPPCNFQGFEAFYDGAMRLSATTKRYFLFLHTHLISYQREGYSQLRQKILNNFQLLSYNPGFNCYPIPKVPLWIFNSLIKTMEPKIKSNILKSFYSDFLCFESIVEKKNSGPLHHPRTDTL